MKKAAKDLVQTFGARSWVAFLLCLIGMMVGLHWVVTHGCDWKLLAVHVFGLFGIQFIITGRSVLDDVADIARAWRGTNGASKTSTAGEALCPGASVPKQQSLPDQGSAGRPD